jgi:hypothetical protein
MLLDTMTYENGIIPIVIGGLGNQLFIVAAAYVAHKETGLPLYILQNPPNFHNMKKHDYNQLLFKHFGIHLPIPQENNVFSNYTKFSPGAFDPWEADKVPPSTYMSGYFQYYPPLKLHEQRIRELIMKALPKAKIAKDYSDYAFLHIRRGDYLNFPDIHYIQPLTYYEESSKHFSKILVMSDDMAWVKSQDFFKASKFELFESDDEIDTLAVMASCTAGAICANSTFSWWGAFLGAHGKRNPVYVPKRWISQPIVSLFPEEWRIL